MRCPLDMISSEERILLILILSKKTHKLYTEIWNMESKSWLVGMVGDGQWKSKIKKEFVQLAVLSHK